MVSIPMARVTFSGSPFVIYALFVPLALTTTASYASPLGRDSSVPLPLSLPAQSHRVLPRLETFRDLPEADEDTDYANRLLASLLLDDQRAEESETSDEAGRAPEREAKEEWQPTKGLRGPSSLGRPLKRALSLFAHWRNPSREDSVEKTSDLVSAVSRGGRPVGQPLRWG